MFTTPPSSLAHNDHPHGIRAVQEQHLVVGDADSDDRESELASAMVTQLDRAEDQNEHPNIAAARSREPCNTCCRMTMKLIISSPSLTDFGAKRP